QIIGEAPAEIDEVVAVVEPDAVQEALPSPDRDDESSTGSESAEAVVDASEVESEAIKTTSADQAEAGFEDGDVVMDAPTAPAPGEEEAVVQEAAGPAPLDEDLQEPDGGNVPD